MFNSTTSWVRVNEGTSTTRTWCWSSPEPTAYVAVA